MGSVLKVLLIGCGHMGAALAQPLISNGEKFELTVVDPDIGIAKSRLGNPANVKFVVSASDLGAEQFEIAIVAVKPDMVASAISAANQQVSGALIISIAAGVSLRALSKSAPATARVVRAMPNLPAMVKQAVTVAYSGDQLTLDDRKAVEAIFGSAGIFSWVGSEDALNAATGVAGSGPGYVFAFTEYLQKAAEGVGLTTQEAALLARQTVIGSARLLEQDSRTARELKLSVATPNGTTAAGLSQLERAAVLEKVLKRTVEAATSRAREISNQT